MKENETINLTVADLRRAHDSVSCSTAKQVIKALKPEAFEDGIKFDPEKVYAIIYSNRIYKLHKLNGKYMFCGLDETCTGTTGFHDTAEDAILKEKKTGSTVMEFNTQKDFINWCYEQTR